MWAASSIQVSGFCCCVCGGCVMGESSSAGTARFSRRTLGTIVLRRLAAEKLSKFGRAWVAVHLDEAKPALLLAQRAGCSERHANFMLRGDRKPSLRAKHALDAEIIS